MNWFVYLLRCSDKTLYCGITNNLDKRIATHNAKKGAKYTAKRTPVKLVWYHPCDNRSIASKVEYQIKQFSRAEKLQLIKGYPLLLAALFTKAV
jgi:putative endonuclease